MFECAVWTWDWANFVIQIVGSVLGFISAILAALGVNKVAEKFKKNKMVKLLKYDLQSELNKKETTLFDIKNSNDLDHRIFYINHLEIMVGTGQIFLLYHESWYHDLMKVYNNIIIINDLLDSKTNFYFNQVLPSIGSSDKESKELAYKALTEVFVEEANKIFPQIKSIIDKMAG